jgi:tRNA-Thr(GGU) m(6)t(6)A37 methyltransferase TsaA
MNAELTPESPPKSAGTDESQVRPGEVQVPLPDRPDASLYFIGRIRTPWTGRKECPKNARASRESGVVCNVEVDPRWAAALSGIEAYSHLVLLYWMDRARRDLVVQTPRGHGEGRPTFALRSPVRPNPIALAVVELRKVEGNRLSVIGVDCLDNTPLLDIKPYFSSTDSIPDARLPDWQSGRRG